MSWQIRTICGSNSWYILRMRPVGTPSRRLQLNYISINVAATCCRNTQHLAGAKLRHCDCACAAICILLRVTVGQVQDRLVSVVQRASSHTQRSVRCPPHRDRHTQSTKRLGVTQSLSLCAIDERNHEVARSRIKLVRVVRVPRVACRVSRAFPLRVASRCRSFLSYT